MTVRHFAREIQESLRVFLWNLILEISVNFVHIHQAFLKLEILKTTLREDTRLCVDIESYWLNNSFIYFIPSVVCLATFS